MRPYHLALISRASAAVTNHPQAAHRLVYLCVLGARRPPSIPGLWATCNGLIILVPQALSRLFSRREQSLRHESQAVDVADLDVEVGDQGQRNPVRALGNLRHERGEKGGSRVRGTSQHKRGGSQGRDGEAGIVCTLGGGELACLSCETFDHASSTGRGVFSRGGGGGALWS